jgi:hypothetical protein
MVHHCDETIQRASLGWIHCFCVSAAAAAAAMDMHPTAGYKPAAQLAAALFFVTAELAAVEPVYQFGLAGFISLYSDSIVKADKARDLARRISNLGQHFQWALFIQVRAPALAYKVISQPHIMAACSSA